MNDEARMHMRNALSTLNRLCDTLENASKNAEDQSLKSRIDGQLANLRACFDECDHIEDNLSQY